MSLTTSAEGPGSSEILVKGAWKMTRGLTAPAALAENCIWFTHAYPSGGCQPPVAVAEGIWNPFLAFEGTPKHMYGITELFQH